jgi:hypothetical protein
MIPNVVHEDTAANSNADSSSPLAVDMQASAVELIDERPAPRQQDREESLSF